MAQIADKINKLIEPVIVDMGYELVGTEYIANGKHSVIRVYIDKEQGIKVDDCANVSLQLGAIFDVEDPVSGQYNLEVSSPGVERPLFNITHYQRFLGADIKLRLFRSVDGRRKFSGTIGQVNTIDNSIKLITELDSIKLDIDMIEKANLRVDF